MLSNVRDKQDLSKNPISDTNLIPIDMLVIDKKSRITLTKRVKKIINLDSNDKIMVYQHMYNKNILLKVQHGDLTISNWILAKSKDDLNNNSKHGNVCFKNKSDSNNNNDNIDTVFVNKFNYNKFNTIKETTSTIKNNKESEECQSKYNTRYRENTLYNIPILLVDDEKDLLTLFDLFLRTEGYINIKTFSDSINVIKHLSDPKNALYYKLAIIDIRMPNINGIQLYQILKILNPSIKIIIITSLDAVNELISLYWELKYTDILRKPFEQDLFIKTVNDKVESIGNQ